MITITREGSADVARPTMAEGWTQSRGGRNAFYELLDGGQAIVLNTGAWRQGTLRLLWVGSPATAATARANALAAEGMHARRGLFRYVDDQLGPLANFVYALDGSMQLYPTESRCSWRLDVPFREA